MNYKLTLIFFSCFAQSIFAQTVNVNNSTELQNALNNAQPGQTIVLANGVYNKSGGFSINANVNGTAQNPITLLGNANTIISANSTATGYGFWLKGNNYWILDGFTVYNSKKGVMLDNSHHNVVRNITVKYIGDEAIHLRTYSSYNTVQNCYIDSVGIVSGPSGTAEGIYVGSANSNWVNYTGGNPDTCNYNIIDGNSFGDNIPSENIDVKEGTSHGSIINNIFNGKGLNGVNSGDSWLDMKGNYYTISCNSGTTTLKDGLQSHIVYAGWGDYNIFYENSTEAFSNAYYGINIQTSGSAGTATHNIVCNSNTVKAGAKGLSNVSTQSCNETCINTAVQNIYEENYFYVYPNPANDAIQIKTNMNNTPYIIRDLSGKIIQQGIISNSIDISILDNGMYLLTTVENGQCVKLIKK